MKKIGVLCWLLSKPCQLLPITKIIAWSITIFTQLNLFLKLAPCGDTPGTVAWSLHRAGDDWLCPVQPKLIAVFQMEKYLFLKERWYFSDIFLFAVQESFYLSRYYFSALCCIAGWYACIYVAINMNCIVGIGIAGWLCLHICS